MVALYILGGFFAAPPIARSQLEKTLTETFQRPVYLQEVSVNPLVLSTEARGFTIEDSDGSQLIAFDRLYINFQLSSLFRWAWTFAAIELEKPSVNLVRREDGKTNVDFLISSDRPVPDQQADTALPRLVIQHLGISGGSIALTDKATRSPFHTVVEPLSLTIDNISTIPEESSQLVLNAQSEQDIRLAWSGALQLNPLQATGTVTTSGGYLTLAYRYFHHLIPVKIDSGNLDLRLDYTLAKSGQGITASVDRLDATLSGIRTSDKATGDTLAVVPETSLVNGQFAWPARRISAETLRMNSAELYLQRTEQGQLRLQKLFAGTPAANAEALPDAAENPAKNEPAPLNDWQLTLGKAIVEDMAIHLKDKSLQDVANLSMTGIGITLQDLSNSDNSRFPLTASARLASGGTLDLTGDVTVLPAIGSRLDLKIDSLDLTAIQPYLNEYTSITLESGTLDTAAVLTHNPETTLEATGELKIADLSATENRRNVNLAGLKTGTLDHFAYSLDGNSLAIDNIALNEPYIGLRIARDKTTNWQLALTPESASGGDGTNDKQETAEAPAVGGQEPDKANPFVLSINQITVSDGASDFADLSLPIPYEAHIVKLKGKTTDIDTRSNQPATLGLEGQVDDYGLARVRGSLLTSSPTQQADINMLFRNVVLPDLTPYAIKFAGRKIADGRMNLDLDYTLDNGRMRGNNQILITDMELGEKVPQEGALDLPLDLALALLKDANGEIDLDLVVEGDTDNPKFDIGSIVAKALANLITKAVTAPFRLLGALVGMESEDFGKIQFEPGAAELTPPEREKLDKLAEAMTQRPRLGLEIPPLYNSTADAESLKQQQLQSRLETLVAESGGDESSREKRLAALENIYSVEFPERSQDEIRARFLSPDGALDANAYSRELRDQLLAQQQLPAGQLEQLARRRADIIRQTLVDNGVDSGRIDVDDATKVSNSRTKWIAIELAVENI